MKLKQLVAQANTTYQLDMDERAQEAVVGRLHRVGFGAEVTTARTSRAIDMILDFAGQEDDRVPADIYTAMKVEAAVHASTEDCSRCKANMRQVSLVGGRSAMYCQPCNITLPLKVED